MRARDILGFGVLGLGLASCRTAKPDGYDAFKIPEEAAAQAQSDDAPASETKNEDGLTAKPSKHDSFKIPNSVIVCSWNIWWFGKKPKKKYDYVTMADFIEECNVIAIQELRDPNANAVIDELLKELKARGWNYEGRISPNTGYENHPEEGKNDYLEHYAFLWDTDTIELKGTPAFVSSPAINNPTYRQVPYVADFRVKNDEDFDFRVLTTHTVYKDKLHEVRKGEIQAIHDWVTTTPADGERNLIAIGDFNANPKGQTKHFKAIVKTNNLYRIAWYESLAAGETSIRTTVPMKDSSTNPTYQTLPLYDHALVSSETSYALTGSSAMTMGGYHFGIWDFDNDPWWKANGWTRDDIKSWVSDHRPIWIRLRDGAEDKD